jgi:polyisoprenyl-phosphate glycosyltransferase
LTPEADIEVSVVCPVFGCSRHLLELVERLENALSGYPTSEIILVCDRSPDDSWEIIKNLSLSRPWVKGVLLAKNVGQQQAISAGIDLASGEMTVVLDCDLQDRPEDTIKLIRELENGEHIAIAHSRFRGRSSRMRSLGRWLYYRSLDALDSESDSGRHRTSSFFALSSTARRAFCLYSERLRLISIIIRDLGFDPVYVEVEHVERRDSNSSYTTRDRINLALDGFILHGARALKYLILVSFVLFFTTLAVAVFVLLRFVLGDTTLPGWFSTIQLLLTITSIQLLSLGVTGLYLHYVVSELRHRPGYVVAEHTWDRDSS